MNAPKDKVLINRAPDGEHICVFGTDSVTPDPPLEPAPEDPAIVPGVDVSDMPHPFVAALIIAWHVLKVLVVVVSVVIAAILLGAFLTLAFSALA